MDDPASLDPLLEMAFAHPMDYLEDNYILHSKLGTGSFANAYKVEELSTGHFFALKKSIHKYVGWKDRAGKLQEVRWQYALTQNSLDPLSSGCKILSNLKSEGKEFKGGIQSDSMEVEGLSSPSNMKPDSIDHVVKLYKSWEQNGILYMLLELCPHGSLSSFLQNYCSEKVMEFDMIYSVLTHLTLGLNLIHSRGLIHLDLKPDNVFLGRNWELKIGDLGLCVPVPDKGSEAEREGDRDYMAPELLQSGLFTQAADIFR